jgi:DNA invertase Pin-like site-specific DNA recombinase
MEVLILKAKTRKEVASEYGISVKTLNRWQKKENINLPPGLIKPLHLQIIYDTFGGPKKT